MLAACAFLIAAIGQGQTAAASTNAAPAPIDSYIHEAWNTLSRSMTDCHSLVDPKIKTAAILYLPKEIAMPADVAALESKCNVKVERLPARKSDLNEGEYFGWGYVTN